MVNISALNMWSHQEKNSVFYVDSDYESLSHTNNKMESEVRTLKQELARTREALRSATKRCRDLVRELDHKTVGHEAEKTLRDQQLSRILRALLVLEGRLRQEQKSIRQLLCEKDNVIRNQQLEIAKLRRYTKNYIKSKRDNTLCKGVMDVDESTETNSTDLQSISSKSDVSRSDSSLSKDIQTLKCEIITKLNDDVDQDHGIRKTHSFAESDVSKTSMTSSENTDVSFTTSGSSPSLISTEGFGEGESTDISPGSTLNKSRRGTPTTVTDEMMSSDNEMALDDTPEIPKRRMGIIRTKPLKIYKRSEGMPRTDSKDDGLDCNFVSDEEPIYENTCKEARVRNCTELTEDNVNESEKIGTILEQNQEETSGNWYSDPDEDRTSDDVFRHSAYQPNSKHNSVLECVNQILLRDMEEEDNMLSIPRRFKHRGRIVRFQPARLSDIESVGSEMERRNSEENLLDKDPANDGLSEVEGSGFEATTSEDEFGMKIVQPSKEVFRETAKEALESPSADFEEPKAIPLVIIEPKVTQEATKVNLVLTPQKSKACIDLSKASGQSPSPPLKMERIEEKTCLQMSTKRLTVAKNLDYEDIESLPDVCSSPKTPPMLPPKPQFRNNTLILKKIPSPSFLINESHKKLSGDGTPEKNKQFFNFSTSPKTSSVKSLTFQEQITKSPKSQENDVYNGCFQKNKFDNIRSSFQSRQNLNNNMYDGLKKMPKVTHIVRHFEEFKIEECEARSPTKSRGREKLHLEFDQDDIRQNFEEFNLDECDLSDDPDRPEGDGSERLNNMIIATQNENPAKALDSGLNGGYDHFLEATGLSTKSILTPSRLLSNHKSMLKPKDVKYKNKIKASAVLEKHNVSSASSTHTHVKHWTGPFV